MNSDRDIMDIRQSKLEEFRLIRLKIRNERSNALREVVKILDNLSNYDDKN